MKKTCNGCRVYTGWGCGLGKKTESVTMEFKGVTLDSGRRPLEECDKPKTNAQFLHLMETKIKH